MTPYKWNKLVFCNFVRVVNFIIISVCKFFNLFLCIIMKIAQKYYFKVICSMIIQLRIFFNECFNFRIKFIASTINFFSSSDVFNLHIN